MNWGIANPVRQEIIVPDADIAERKKKGDPLPCRPNWLCITSPEYAGTSSLTGEGQDDPTVEELDAMEAEQAAREAAREAKAERRRLEADAARKLKKALDAAEKLAREERARKNKAAGKPHRKREVKIVYHNRHKADWE